MINFIMRDDLVFKVRYVVLGTSLDFGTSVPLLIITCPHNTLSVTVCKWCKVPDFSLQNCHPLWFSSDADQLNQCLMCCGCAGTK